MKFFDDPSEVDHQIQNLKDCINSEDWQEVNSLVNSFILVIKKELLSMNQDDFHALSGCTKISDILDIKRHLSVYGTEEFSSSLKALFRMQAALNQSTIQVKQDFHKEVDMLQRYLQKIILIFAMPEKWKIEKKYKKIEKGLENGRKQLKGMISLYACINDILKEKGFDTKKSDIFKKLWTYTDEYPYQYQNYDLKYDAEAEKFYQIDKETLKERSCTNKKIYDYIKKIKKK